MRDGAAGAGRRRRNLHHLGRSAWGSTPLLPECPGWSDRSVRRWRERGVRASYTPSDCPCLGSSAASGLTTRALCPSRERLMPSIDDGGTTCRNDTRNCCP